MNEFVLGESHPEHEHRRCDDEARERYPHQDDLGRHDTSSFAPRSASSSASCISSRFVGELRHSRSATASFGPCSPSWAVALSLIHISEPTRLGMISYAVF